MTVSSSFRFCANNIDFSYRNICQYRTYIDANCYSGFYIPGWSPATGKGKKIIIKKLKKLRYSFSLGPQTNYKDQGEKGTGQRSLGTGWFAGFLGQ